MRSSSMAKTLAALITATGHADITFYLDNRTFTGFSFAMVGESYGGSIFGTLTGATINVTLNTSVAYTYADDLCVYVDTLPLSAGGFLQIGGFSSLGAAQRYSWPNGSSSRAGTTSIGTVNLTTPLQFWGNPSQYGVIWIGNGYGATGTSGTWTGTVTLHGVDCWGSTFYRDLDGDGFGSPLSGTVYACDPPTGYVSNGSDCDDHDPSLWQGQSWYRDLDGDGYGASSSGTVVACTQPSGYASSSTDCNDNSAQINPNTTWYRDTDGDGIGYAANGTLVQCAQPSGYALANGDNCPTIANANQADTNSNGLGDVCEFARGDLNLDGVVNASDMPLFLNAWGSAGPLGDLNFDGTVNSSDFTVLLSNWGTHP